MVAYKELFLIGYLPSMALGKGILPALNDPTWPVTVILSFFKWIPNWSLVIQLIELRI